MDGEHTGTGRRADHSALLAAGGARKYAADPREGGRNHQPAVRAAQLEREPGGLRLGGADPAERNQHRQLGGSGLAGLSPTRLATTTVPPGGRRRGLRSADDGISGYRHLNPAVRRHQYGVRIPGSGPAGQPGGVASYPRDPGLLARRVSGARNERGRHPADP